MGGRTISTSETKIEAIKLQSSSYGVTIPIVYGVTRVAGNLLWYGGFKAIPHTETTSGGKGGVKVQNTTYTYTASVAMGLCEGEITAIKTIWVGKEQHNGGINPNSIVTVSEQHSVPASTPFNVTVAHNSTFSTNVGVGYWGQYGGDRGDSSGNTWVPMAEGYDYTQVDGVYTFTDRWASQNLQFTYQYLSGSPDETALTELGLSFKSGAIGQAAWSYLNTSCAPQSIGYSGIAYVCGQDYSLGTGAQVENHLFEIQASQAYSISANIPDANPAIIAADVIQNGRYGAGFPSSQIGGIDIWGNYCLSAGIVMSPAITEQQQASDFIDQMCKLTNTAPLWSMGKLTFIPFGDANLSGSGATYVPDLTPIYDLTDDDYVTTGQDSDPVKVTRKSQSDSFNHIKVEFVNRARAYNIEIAEAKDAAAIDAFGLRTMDTVSAHWICDANVARNVAQLMLQRTLFIRNTYTFTLACNKDFLEPMDLLTLTDAGIGLNKLPVRITSVEESNEGHLTIECEEFPLGVAASAIYQSQSATGFRHDYSASAGNAATPVIFEMPGSLTTTGLELGIATCGTTEFWGGCDVWASYDGNSYVQIGVISGGSRFGYLTEPIAYGVADVQMMHGQLLGTSSDVGPLGTLCYIGGASQEFIAYETATLTGNGTYALSGLARGSYETPIVAHNTNDPFVRVDDAISTSAALDKSLIGTTVYIKLCSFNIYGAAKQSLAEVNAYEYVVTGVFAATKPGIRTFQQEEPPTSETIGDLWTEISTGNTYRWSGTQWVLQSTIGANADTFTGIVGIGNLLQYSSFRTDQDSDGMADGWVAANTNNGSQPITFNRIDAGGLFGGDAQQVAWGVGATTPKGLKTTANGGVLGGWMVETEYMVSGYAKSSTSNGYKTLDLVWNNQPISVAWPVAPLLTSDYQRFAARVAWGPTVEANGALWITMSNPAGVNDITFSALQVTEGNILTEYVEATQDLRNAAEAAQAEATSAANMAQTALDQIGGAVSDNLLVPSEKRMIVVDYNAAVNERQGIVNQALDFNVPSTSYNSSVANMISYMATLTSNVPWYDMTGTTTVVGTTFLAKWSSLYAERQALLNAIAAKAKATADTAGTIANSAAGNASNAIVAANNASAQAANAVLVAQAASDYANQVLADIGVSASDNTLIPSEKRALITDYNIILAEQSGINTQAANYGIVTERATYNTSITSLTNYLNNQTTPTAWNNIGGSTTIVGSTFVSKWADVYTSKQSLLNAISAKAKVLADNAANTATSAAANSIAAQNNAIAALNNATAAQANAILVNQAVANMSADNVLTPVEKYPLIQDYYVIVNEYGVILQQAADYNINVDYPSIYTAYVNARDALTQYLTSLTSPVAWNNTTDNTNIVGASLRTAFENYFTTKETILVQIAAEAGTRAAWAGIIDVPYEKILNNLIDPSWWRPGATWEWAKGEDVVGETSIIFGIGPKDSIQALVRTVAAGTPYTSIDGGWVQGSIATTPKNAFTVDTTKTYRFVVPVKKVSGSTTVVWWGTSGGVVCLINTTTPQDNPYFAVSSQLVAGRWYYMVGYIFPAGSTGTSNAGAGVYDCSTGALVASDYAGNVCWASGATEASTRAYQFYSSTGSEVLFGQPFVHVVNGAEPSLRELLSNSAVLNSEQQWSDVTGRPDMFSVLAKGYLDTQAPIASGMYDAETGIQLYGSTRSYNLAVIDKATGNIWHQTYDVYGSGGVTQGRTAATLASDLNAQAAGQIAVIWTYDEPQTHRQDSGLPEAMYRCGASRACFNSPMFLSHSAYILVGVVGCGEGNGFEAYQGAVDNDTNAWCDVAFQIKNGSLIVSGGTYTPRTLHDYGPVQTDNVEPDAATKIYRATLQGPTTYTSTLGNGSHFSDSYFPVSVDVSVPPTLGGNLIMHADMDVLATIPAGWQPQLSQIYAAFVISVPGVGYVIPTGLGGRVFPASYSHMSLSDSLNVIGSGYDMRNKTVTVYLRIDVNTNQGAGYQSVQISNVSFRVEHIKL